MAIQLLASPNLFTPCGLQNINPITLVFERDNGEAYMNIEVFKKFDASETFIATLQGVFLNDNTCTFEISQVLKSFFNPVQPLGIRRLSPEKASVPPYIFIDTTETNFKFAKYGIKYNSIEVFEGYVTYADKISYERYYVQLPAFAKNDQSNFLMHTITADDVGVPTYELLDFDETDFNFEDFN